MPLAFLSRRMNRFDSFTPTREMALSKLTGSFPLLNGADTMVMLSDQRHYKLHSMTLRQCSPLFAKLLDKESTVKSASIRFHVVLQNYDKHTGEEILPVFRRVDLDVHGRPNKPVSVIHENDKSNVDSKLLDCYDKVLASLFNIEPTLDTTNIAKALADATALVSAAEYFGSVSFIAKSIDNALISMGQDLHKAIASSPVVWIDLGYRLRSKIIFKESLAHIVGRYKKFTAVEANVQDSTNTSDHHCVLDSLQPPVRKLLHTKAMELQETCKRIDQKLLTYYPASMYRQSSSDRADRDNIGRAGYAADIFGWMALSLFRHYIGYSVASDESHRAADGGYAFYKAIQTGGYAYLDRQTVAGFHDRFPMSAKGRSVYANHLELIKEAAKDYVKPLMENNTTIETEKYPVKWLLCVRLEDSELPWAKPQIVQHGKDKGKQTERKHDTASEDDDDFEAISDFDPEAEAGYLDARFGGTNPTD